MPECLAIKKTKKIVSNNIACKNSRSALSECGMRTRDVPQML